MVSDISVEKSQCFVLVVALLTAFAFGVRTLQGSALPAVSPSFLFPVCLSFVWPLLFPPVMGEPLSTLAALELYVICSWPIKYEDQDISAHMCTSERPQLKFTTTDIMFLRLLHCLLYRIMRRNPLKGKLRSSWIRRKWGH